MVLSARLECGEPAAEASELIRRQLGDGFGDFFDLHATQYSTWLSYGKGLRAVPLRAYRHRHHRGRQLSRETLCGVTRVAVAEAVEGLHQAVAPATQRGVLGEELVGATEPGVLKN